MTKKEKRNRLSGKSSYNKNIFYFALGTVLIFGLTSLSLQDSEPQTQQASVLESLTGIPTKILSDAFENGGFSLYFWGTKIEKHNFGKGRATRFGQMSFNADSFLKRSKGWSESRIHSLGHQHGFSEKWQ